MAGRIFIEADEAEVAGLPIGAMHLYLVFRDVDGAEYVIRSGPSRVWGGEMKVEVNVPIADSADDRGGGTPEERASTELRFPALGTDAAWAIMVKYARIIEAQDYAYDALDENSNAFIGAMLHAAGADPYAMLPTGVSEDEALGFEHYPDLVADIAPPEDGTVYGTRGADAISGIQVGEIIRALRGADRVRAGRGDDRVGGGRGDDRLWGEDGDDLIAGGPGADRIAGGTGTNRLWGGAGADVFVFAESAPSSDRVLGFEDGIDLIRIEAGTVATFGDLTIGRAGPHAVIAFGGSEIEIGTFDLDLLDPSDFVFAPDPPGLA